MKKILLTGSEGFVGRNLKESLEQRPEFILYCPKQAEINLVHSAEAESCISSFQPDTIIHSATSNTLGKGYDSDVCEQNLRMFFNLLRYRPDGCVIYTLCSGSSYNRENWIENMDEDYLGIHIPEDSQGFSKFVIATYARHLHNVVTLRLFGIFGKYEDYRYKLISNTIAKRLTGIDVTLVRDAVYDYLDVDDFCMIVHQLIEQKIHAGEFNVTPDHAVKLSQLVEIIDEQLKISTDFSIVTPGLGRPYTGSNKRLAATIKGLQFTPVATSIAKLINYYRKNPQLIDKHALEQDQLLQYAKSINKQ